MPYAIEALRPFSDQILISLCTHRFDGTPENNQKYFDKIHDCTFVEYAFSDRLYGTEQYIDPNSLLYHHHWHNTSRLVPTYFLDSEIEYVLFLDADEIIDTKRFMQMDWPQDACRLASYWYFRDPSFQATTWSDSIALLEKKHVNPDILLHPKERTGWIKTLNGKSMVLGQDQKPLVHHYSWVRTQAEMLEKVKCWAHGFEDDWQNLIEKEMSSDFSGTDFVYGYDYKKVKPFIDPFQTKSNQSGKPSIVHHVTPRDIYNLEVQRCFLTPTLT